MSTTEKPAAFRRLCVETATRLRLFVGKPQPPSGGCVLKQHICVHKNHVVQPAAFRRLCVETVSGNPCRCAALPAAFRRLCVETIVACDIKKD